MDIQLLSAVATTTLVPAQTPVTGPKVGVPGDSETQAFQAMLQPDASASDPVAAAAPAEPAEPAVSATAPAAVPPTQGAPMVDPAAPVTPVEPVTFGQAILHKLEQLRGDIGDKWQGLMQVGDSGHPLSGAEMLGFQMKAIEVSYEFEFAGKVVGKSEQNIETLVKMQ